MTIKKVITLTAIISLFTMISCQRNQTIKNEYSDKFVAHGGGSVEGYTKTNSLEGLNTSYKNGFRMFELDFQLTTDGKVVAVHDPIDITEEDFLSRPIEGKFTPMNMQMINDWFESHPDAILVTDKINRPDLFAEQFKFKERLIMEMFTWKTVTEAIELGITPMVSQDIFWGTLDIEKKLDSLNITIIGMHRDYLYRDTVLLKKLKAKGIKTYVWFTSKKIEGMKPEDYIWENDMNYCYGMYANSLLDVSQKTSTQKKQST